MKKFVATVELKHQTFKTVNKWRPFLFLNEWVLNVNFAHYNDDGRPNCVAEIDADPIYKEATITLFPKHFDKDPEARESILVHELCHILTTPVKRLASKVIQDGEHISWPSFRDADEFSTTHVANAILSLERGLKEAYNEELVRLRKRKNGKRQHA